MPARHVIVGSGIAGLSAAEAIRAYDPRAEITLISEEPHAFYSRPGLAYFLRGDIPEKQLLIRTPRDGKDLNIQRLDGRVERLECGPHELVMADGRRVRYDRLLLATGALAAPPSFPGADLEGVVKLDGLDDARTILGLVKRGQPAVVVGGGITALELAEGLAARGMRVHYFLRGTRYWGDVLDETESAIVMQRLRHEGITIHTETQVKRAFGVRGTLSGVETQSGAHLNCRVLAVAIGVRPRADLARQAGLAVNKGIVVDSFLRTSAADVFAAGDVAEVRDPRTGASHLDVLWPIALAQGKAVGATMAGTPREYVKGVPFNVTMLAGLKVAIIGSIGGGASDDRVAISRGESEVWRQSLHASTVSDHGDVNRYRLLVGERTILGALVMGDQTCARAIQHLVRDQVDVTPIRQALLAGGAAAMRELLAFFDRLQKSPYSHRGA